MKCPNGLSGPVSVQASIKGVGEAWLEQRDPLGLTSAVPTRLPLRQGLMCHPHGLLLRAEGTFKVWWASV